MKRRITALFLAGIMLISLCACTGTENSGGNVALTKDDVISITMLTSSSNPYNADWKIWDYIEEGTGVTVEPHPVISSDYFTKYSLMFAAPETVTDLTVFDYKPDSDVYVNQGAFVALDDLEEHMPNYKAFVESLSEVEFNSIVKTRKAFDGKIYYAPATGREKTRGIRAWLYREDIFNKHGLKAPTTYDELYEVCKQLKELYPESYPLAQRSKLSNLEVTGSSWKEYWEPGAYYDYTNDEWHYGAIEDVAREVVTFYKKMIDEGLLASDFYSMSEAGWTELITTDRGFIMPDYQTRIDYFNKLAREKKPDFTIQAIEPPVATEKGVSKVGKYNYETFGFAMANKGDDLRKAKVAKFVDWFYTDEAMELVSWGKEGETYEIVDGKKQYITDSEGSAPNKLYGINTYGTFLRLDPEVTTIVQSEDIAKTREMILEHTVDYVNPIRYLAYVEEEQKVIDQYAAALKTHTEEMLIKFILGQEPISNFDAFVENVKSMGVDELLTAYSSAYDRIK